MKLSDVKPGDLLECDAGFTCLGPYSVHRVYNNDEGKLYIHCDDGWHYLDGQTDDNGNLIGLRWAL